MSNNRDVLIDNMSLLNDFLGELLDEYSEEHGVPSRNLTPTTSAKVKQKTTCHEDYNDVNI